MDPTGLDRMLVLCLLTVSVTLKGTCAQIMNFEIDRGTPKCGQDMLAGYDTMKINGFADLQQSTKKQWPQYVIVELGDPTTTFTMFCILPFPPSQCAARTGPGCYCSGVDKKQKLFNLHIEYIVASNMSNAYVRITWPSKKKSTVVWMEKMGQIYGEAVPIVTVRGQPILLTNGKCPVLPFDNVTIIDYCVGNLKNPRLGVSFDASNTYSFHKECAQLKVIFSVMFTGTSYYFMFKDDCQRNETFKCTFPETFSVISESSSLSYVTWRVLLAVIMAGNLLSGFVASK